MGTPAADNQAPIQVTNDGNAPLVIANGANAIRIQADAADGGAATAADFAVVSDNCRGKTLAPNASCTINVGFKPTRSNFTSVARIVIDSNSDDAVERDPDRRRADAAEGARVPRRRRRDRDAGVAAIKALGDGNDFKVDETADAAAFTAANLAQLPRGRLPRQQGRPAQRRPGDRPAGLHPGRRRLRRHRCGRRGRARQHLRHRPDRRPSGRRQPDHGLRPGRRVRRPRASVHRGPAARVDAQRHLLPLDHAPHGHGPHRRALPRDQRPGRRRHHHGRHRLADLLVPRLPGRPLLLHRHGPDGRQLRPGRPQQAPAGRDPVVRGPRPRRLQGHDHVQLLDRARRQRRQRRPDQQRRVARRLAGQQRLGDLHRPRRLPHQRRARQDDRPGFHARSSSTSPTATSASAAARSTSTTRRPTTAPSTPASRRRQCCPSTATVAEETRSTARSRPACSASPPRPTSPRPATSTCSTSRRSTRTTRSTPGMADGDAAPHHQDGPGAHLALHHQPARPRSSTSTPRS